MEIKVINLFETSQNNTAKAIAERLGLSIWRVNKIIDKHLLKKRIY